MIWTKWLVMSNIRCLQSAVTRDNTFLFPSRHPCPPPPQSPYLLSFPSREATSWVIDLGWGEKWEVCLLQLLGQFIAARYNQEAQRFLINAWLILLVTVWGCWPFFLIVTCDSNLNTASNWCDIQLHCWWYVCVSLPWSNLGILCVLASALSLYCWHNTVLCSRSTILTAWGLELVLAVHWLQWEKKCCKESRKYVA